MVITVSDAVQDKIPFSLCVYKQLDKNIKKSFKPNRMAI